MPLSRPVRGAWVAFGVSAVISLLLSPIAAIFGLVIGSAGLVVTAAIPRRRAGALAVFAGIAAGNLPYVLAGLVISVLS